MKPFHRILVPIDFGDCSRSAVEHALYLAQSFNATIELLHVVWDPPPYVGFESVMVQVPRSSSLAFSEYTRAAAARELERFLEHFTPAERQGMTTRFAHGEASNTVLSVAEDEHFDLIVMGTHGRTGLSHMLMGSVAEKVVRRAPCPVLTIRPCREPAGATTPAIAPA